MIRSFGLVINNNNNIIFVQDNIVHHIVLYTQRNTITARDFGGIFDWDSSLSPSITRTFFLSSCPCIFAGTIDVSCPITVQLNLYGYTTADQ